MQGARSDEAEVADTVEAAGTDPDTVEGQRDHCNAQGNRTAPEEEEQHADQDTRRNYHEAAEQADCRTVGPRKDHKLKQEHHIAGATGSFQNIPLDHQPHLLVGYCMVYEASNSVK